MCDDHSGVLVEIPGAQPRGHLGTKRAIDACIAPLVKALNDAGQPTLASCCGHGKRPSNIVLEDGREVLIARNWEEARLLDAFLDALYDGDHLRRERDEAIAEVERLKAKAQP